MVCTLRVKFPGIVPWVLRTGIIYDFEDVVRLRGSDRQIRPIQADWQRMVLPGVYPDVFDTFATVKLFGKTGSVLASTHTTQFNDGLDTRTLNLVRIHGDPAYLSYGEQPTMFSVLLNKVAVLLGYSQGAAFYNMAKCSRNEADLELLGDSLQELVNQYACTGIQDRVQALVPERMSYGRFAVQSRRAAQSDDFPTKADLVWISNKSYAAYS